MTFKDTKIGIKKVWTCKDCGYVNLGVANECESCVVLKRSAKNQNDDVEFSEESRYYT